MTTPTLTERETSGAAIFRACEENPADTLSLLAYADWLTEQGADASLRLAHAYRWMAGQDTYPGNRRKKRSHDYRTTWYWLPASGAGKLKGLFPDSVLLDVLYTPLVATRSDRGCKTFCTYAEAVHALAEALHYVRCYVGLGGRS